MEWWQRRRTLGEQVSAKRRLYLDVRFWNDLCDADLGSSKDQRSAHLLAALRDAVKRGSVICPVEFHVVEELHRQRIPEKRRATLALVDELSQRTVLAAPTDRLLLEVLRLVQGLIAGNAPTTPPLGEIWTRPLFAISHDFPELEAPPGLPPALVAQLRAEMHEEWWAMGFLELFAITGPPPIDPSAKITTAGMLNDAKSNPANLFDSYEATYWSEVRGALDAYLPQLEDIWRYLFQRDGGDPSAIDPSRLRESAIALRHLLYKAARKVGLKSTVPSLHTGVTLYSRIMGSEASLQGQRCLRLRTRRSGAPVLSRVRNGRESGIVDSAVRSLQGLYLLHTHEYGGASRVGCGRVDIVLHLPNERCS